MSDGPNWGRVEKLSGIEVKGDVAVVVCLQVLFCRLHVYLNDIRSISDALKQAFKNLVKPNTCYQCMITCLGRDRCVLISSRTFDENLSSWKKF